MVSTSRFDHESAFDRNIGFMTELDLQRLKRKNVAIAGLGGVGGANLMMLVRLGIGGFHLADHDTFELANFNRQVGASMATLGMSKVDVMSAMARDVNPELRITTFPGGIEAENINAFLEDVDLFVDGLDFFCIELRARVFRRCRELGIPAVTAAPVGLGTSYLVFLPGEMSFEEYFGVEGRQEDEQLRRFAAGLAPRRFYSSYLVDPTRMQFRERRVSSSPVGISLAAGAVGAEAMKILLGRGTVRPAPWCHQFDPFVGHFVCSRGSVARLLRGRAADVPPPAKDQIDPVSRITSGALPVERILDVARWAPSGDNSQPWTFEITSHNSVRVHLQDRMTDDLYDYDARPTLLSGGMLLETMRLAASREGRDIDFASASIGKNAYRIDVSFRSSKAIEPDPMIDFVRLRSVDRRPYRWLEFSPHHRRELELALGEHLDVCWLDSTVERLRFAFINARTSEIRLRLPEIAAVHERVLRFEQTHPREGIPAVALGVSPIMTRLIQLAVERPEIASRITRIMGTKVPSLELDIIPGLFCSAHFLVSTKHAPEPHAKCSELLHAGMRLQKFWLAATALGLVIQPSVAPLCFAYHSEHGRRFPGAPGADEAAQRIASELRSMAPGKGSEHFVFAGRLGAPTSRPVLGRSMRRALSELVVASRVDAERPRVEGLVS